MGRADHTDKQAALSSAVNSSMIMPSRFFLSRTGSTGTSSVFQDQGQPFIFEAAPLIDARPLDVLWGTDQSNFCVTCFMASPFIRVMAATASSSPSIGIMPTAR